MHCRAVSSAAMRFHLSVWMVVGLLGPRCAVGQSRGTSAIAATAMPATATILTLDAAGDTLALGSGFVFRAGGVVVTNWHVVAGAARAVVFLPGYAPIGDVYALAGDSTLDLAVLKLPGSRYRTLVPASLPAVGARLVVIGSPLGLSQTVSEGIVSAIRVFNGRRLLQMSAPISPGSSGGPVLNDRGAVVAVATAYLAGGQQLNFAVPIAEAVRLSTASAHAAPRPLSAVFGVAAKASGRSPSAPSTAIPGWTFVGYVHSEDVTGPQDSLMRHIRPNRDGTYVVRDEYRVDHALADGKRWRVAYSTISAGCADEYWTWRSTEYRTQQGDLVYVDAVVLTLRRTEGSTQSGTSMVATVYRYACSSR